MESYKTGKQKKYTMGVQNEAEWCPEWFCCSAVRAGRAGRGLGIPLAERERYSGTVLHNGVHNVHCVNQKSRML